MLAKNPKSTRKFEPYRTTVACGLALLLCRASGAQQVLPVGGDKQLVLLEGKEAVTAILEDQIDPFFSSLSRIDVELRLSEPLPNRSQQERLSLLKKQFRDAVKPWTETEIEGLSKACQLVASRAQSISPDFVPNRWKFVKTDGSEESQAAYTRHDTIILPQSMLERKLGTPYALAKLVAHETSHVFTRLHPEVRDALYAWLGFRHVGPIELGDALDKVRITNPDGVRLEHSISVNTPTGRKDVVLVTLSKSESYQPAIGRRLFDYLQFRLAALETKPNGVRVQHDQAGKPVLFQVKEVGNFFEQIGRNTKYIIHPDEILAENLSLLFTQGIPGEPVGAVADSKLLRDLAQILRRKQ